MAFISDIEYEGKSRDPWFKFLGRFLIGDLTEKHSKSVLFKLVSSAGEKIEAAALRGCQKVWIWDAYVMSMISWQLMIHDINQDWVRTQLAPIQIRWFCKWLGYKHRGSNKSIFFRSNEHHGLQLKEMCTWHTKNRLVRRHILSTSKDPQVRAIHEGVTAEQAKRAESKTNEWKDCMELRSLTQAVVFEKMRGSLKQDDCGLGWGSRYVTMSKEKAERQAILRIYQEEVEQKLIVNVLTNLQHFGEWVKWEAAMQIDKRWHSLLAYENDNQLKFRLLATEDQYPTPSLLRAWGGVGDGMCPLGCASKGSLKHILTGCRLNEEPQSRITWRHDSILLAIFKGVAGVVKRVKKCAALNRLNGIDKAETMSVNRFKSESNSSFCIRVPKKLRVLEEATDWKLQFDLTAPQYGQSKEKPFPEEVLASPGSRPDGVIWSNASKTVTWIELTSPHESNMKIRHEEKNARYNQLKLDCESKGWKVVPLSVEVGCLGHASQSFQYMCNKLGFTKQEASDLKYAVEKTAFYCSHSIVAARYQKFWEPKPPLDVSKWA